MKLLEFLIVQVAKRQPVDFDLGANSLLLVSGLEWGSCFEPFR